MEAITCLYDSYHDGHLPGTAAAECLHTKHCCMERKIVLYVFCNRSPTERSLKLRLPV